jgi:hypothetical protein
MPVTRMSVEMMPTHQNIFVQWDGAAFTETHKPGIATVRTPKISCPRHPMINTQ